MKRFKATYYYPKLDKKLEMDVFALDLKQAYEMYADRQYCVLVSLIPCN